LADLHAPLAHPTDLAGGRLVGGAHGVPTRLAQSRGARRLTGMRTLRFVLSYLSLNLSAAMEYRAAFLVQAFSMMLNDLIFVVFWALYFARFPDVGGWGVHDVAILWAIAATSIGLSATLLGNCTRVATIIVQGQLD